MKVTCKDGNCPAHNTNACCYYCDEKSNCPDCCSNTPEDCGHAEELNDETALIGFNTQYMAVMKEIADVCGQKKALEEKEKKMKDQLKAAMEAYGIKSADTPLLKLTYVAATTQTTVNSAKLKKKYPAIAAEVSKTTPKSAYVKVEVKGGEE